MSTKLFNLFKKNKKNKKIDNQINKDTMSSDKIASYYDTDKQKYVITTIPEYMNIINNKNSIKKPSKLENIAGVFLDNSNIDNSDIDNSDIDNSSIYKNKDETQVSVNLLEHIIKENTDINTDTSYDSFFDVDLYSEFSDEDDNTNSSVYSDNSEDSVTSINDLDTSFREDTKSILGKQKKHLSNEQLLKIGDMSLEQYDPYLMDSDVESEVEEKLLDSDNDNPSVASEKSNIFSSRYRNKKKKNKCIEPSELMYIPSEN
jgi:hypothetical protein